MAHPGFSPDLLVCYFFHLFFFASSPPSFSHQPHPPPPLFSNKLDINFSKALHDIITPSGQAATRPPLRTAHAAYVHTAGIILF